MIAALSKIFCTLYYKGKEARIISMYVRLVIGQQRPKQEQRRFRSIFCRSVSIVITTSRVTMYKARDEGEVFGA